MGQHHDGVAPFVVQHPRIQHHQDQRDHLDIRDVVLLYDVGTPTPHKEKTQWND